MKVLHVRFFCRINLPKRENNEIFQQYYRSNKSVNLNIKRKKNQYFFHTLFNLLC